MTKAMNNFKVALEDMLEPAILANVDPKTGKMSEETAKKCVARVLKTESAVIEMRKDLTDPAAQYVIGLVTNNLIHDHC